MFSHNLRPFAAAISAALLLNSPAMANIVITGTRVIYPADKKEVTVKLDNKGDTPSLVQSWLDSGDSQANPSESCAPFVLTPPMARIDPGKGQALRLIYNGTPLPADRESVFYLNVLEIPPLAKAAPDQNILHLAFRSRIKVFYRPQNMPGNPMNAPDQLRWENIGPEQGGYAVEAYNPTPYHVSLVELSVADGQARYLGGNGMVPPGGRFQFLLEGMSHAPTAGAVISFKAINDYGALVPGQASLAP